MKFAFHSIAWGERATDLRRILRESRSAGYGGIELFQDVRDLGGIQKVFEAFQEEHCHLVGICSGSFEERIRHVSDYSQLLGVAPSDTRAPYVYADDWDSRHGLSALRNGVRIAIHPHMYQPIQTMQEAEELFKAYPRLLFLPDTAHLTIAGDDPAEAIGRRLRDSKCPGPLASIHLKDWQSNVGRGFHFYARGFCELGRGEVWSPRLRTSLLQLFTVNFPGWLVVEQDRTDDAVRSAIESMEWLRRHIPPAAYGGRPAHDQSCERPLGD